MSTCRSECDCDQPTGHAPDCHYRDECDEGRYCDKHMAEAEAEHAYLRGSDPRFVFGADAQPATEFEFNQQLRDAGRGHLVRE